MAGRRPLRGIWLGTRSYQPVVDLQNRLREAVAEGACQQTVLFLEHRPVITLGRGADGQHVLMPEAMLADRGFEVAKTDRGGDVTLHAPGQLVAYPIVDLRGRRDVRWYVRTLTETMRRLVTPFGIDGGEMPGMVGLWVDVRAPGRWPGPESAAEPAKVGAIGVRLSRWIATHGFALNLSTDLSAFEWIVPCGISAYRVTSVTALCAAAVTPRDVAADAYAILAELLDLEAGDLEDASTRSLEEV